MSDREWWAEPFAQGTLLLSIFFVPLLVYLLVVAIDDLGDFWPLIVFTFMYVAMAASEWGGWD